MRPEDAVERLLELHHRIRRRVLAAQRTSEGSRGGDPAAGEAAVEAEGAGDVTFRLDAVAEAEIEGFAEDLARETPLTVVSEGLGTRRFGARGAEPGLRLVVDPIDGTRNLMFDLRSGWSLTALAREKGDATRLSDVFAAVQGELPVRDRRTAAILSAAKGGGARLRRVDLETEQVVADGPLVAPDGARLDNGYHVFFKFNREERAAIGRIEQRYLELLAEVPGVDARFVFDDQYISSAGQLWLLLTRRYRFVADLRGAVGDRLGIANQTSKPYDVCCALIAAEAGAPVTDLEGAPLDLPLDLHSRVTLVGYANAAVRARLEPLLRRAWSEFEAGAR